jgi:hypothetical protein
MKAQMRLAWGIAVVAAVVATCTPQTALAQAGTTTGVRSSSYNSWGGAFDASPYGAMDMADKVAVDKLLIKPHFGAWIAYDDNVYFTSDDEVGDYSLTLAPGVLLLYGNPSHNYVSANYTFEWVQYQDETDLDYEGHHLAADGHYELSKSTLHVSDRYEDTRVDVVEDNSEVERQNNALQARIERYISSKTSAGVDGLYEINNYIDDQYIDYDEYRVGGRFYYRVQPKTDVFADYGYGWVDLDSLPDALNDELQARYNRAYDDGYGDATYQQISVGLRGELGRKTTASGRVGYESREFEDDSIEGIDEWVMGAGLATKFSGRMEGGVELSRRIFPWASIPGNSAVALSVSPYLRRQLYRNRVSGSVSATYESTDYFDPDGEMDKNDETWTFTGLLDWRLFRNVTLGAGYSYTNYDSTDADSDAERNRYIARAMYNY